MRPVSPTLQTYLDNPNSYWTECLVLVSARDRSTGAVEQAGFWTGDRHRNFSLGADGTHLFYGAGSMLETPEIVYEAGLQVASFDIEFSPMTPEFVSIARVYDLRQQPFKMYEAYFSAETGKLIETPTRIYRGFSDGLNIVDGEESKESKGVLQVVSSARNLTRTLPGKCGDETLRLRGDDRIGRYANVAGAVTVIWGRKSPKTTTATTTERRKPMK